MTRRNNQSNRLIKWIVTAADFLLLNALIWIFAHWHPGVSEWNWETKRIFLLICNIALMLSETRFSTIIHLRLVGAGDIFQRVVGLTVLQVIIAYILMKVFCWWVSGGSCLSWVRHLYVY